MTCMKQRNTLVVPDLNDRGSRDLLLTHCIEKENYLGTETYVSTRV
jgi:hypothetical protein